MTFFERVARLAAKQGIAISKELHAIIVKATEEVAALDKRLMGLPEKRAPKKSKRSKAKSASNAKVRTREKKTSPRRPTAASSKRKRTAGKARKGPVIE